MKNSSSLKISFLFILLLSSFCGFAQYTIIPDSNFEQALIDLNIDSGAIDGKVLTSKITNLQELKIPAKNISDLTGIEDFLNLETLDLSVINNDPTLKNKISNLDITKNIKLKYLNCSYNNLTNLDVSKNLDLKELHLDSNKLNSIDISNNTFLQNFSCSNNNLTSLDISKNTSLEYLTCSFNQLTNIDVSKNLSLLQLSCYNNQLTSLDVSKNTKINIIACEVNQISSLNVNSNILLQGLICDNNLLSSLDTTKNTSLFTLSTGNNKITSLDVSKNQQLIYLGCAYNQLTSIDVSKLLNVTYIAINNNQITSLDVTKNTSLEILQFSSTNISTIDVSKNLKLTDLYVGFSMLSNLDISKNPNLKSVTCNSNSLNTLNLKNGNNSKLSNISFVNNPNLSCIQVDDASYSNANWSTYKDASTLYSNNCNAVATTAPILQATGNQLYCPQTNIKIVEDFSITHDPSETGTEAIYIQISSGYAAGFDKLELSNLAAHPLIAFNWDPSAGKLTLSSTTGGDVLYSELVLAIKDIVFSNSSATASGNRTFSITLGQANYLPSTQHYYQYIPSVGITWTNAKAAAESDANIYYGIRGYLATILSADEAKLIGEQASGTGWIGGSDAETEGVWKWVTGPEAGTVFWNGNANGSTPNYAFWNNGEPNQQGDEDYAHITQPGVGVRGSWNDLSNTGSLTPGDSYQPKGYIVEYGGMPGDPILQIATSTKITIPVITTLLTPNPVCDSGSFTINATATTGATISWYDAATGGNLLATGNTFTTPVINTTTIYYADAGCETNRKSITAVVNKTPNNPVSNSPTVTNCGPGSVTLQASSDVGVINWFTDATGGTSVFTGNNFTTPSISSNVTYYAEASNNGCINPNRTPVNIIIYKPPVVMDETLVLCQSQKITLDAGLTGMTYLWSNGAITQSTEVNAGGTYTVVVTNPGPGNCSSTKKVTVNEHLKPKINKIDVEGTRAIIYTTKTEDYFEYSVDGVNFQDSNIFYDVPGGLQTAYVREKSGCGQDTQQFVVLVFPAFFTPNNDSYNDVWEVTGMENYPQAEVTIFDRYGKLIANLNHSKMSWDGTLERTPLPASDYWYALKIDNTLPILKGHFSLKR